MGGLLRECLSPGSSLSFHKIVDEDATVAQVIKELDLPDNIARIILVNGHHARPDYVLKEGDVLSVFPTIAGG